jgi:hypothetical protein
MKKYIKAISFIACLTIIGNTVNFLLTKTVKGRKVAAGYKTMQSLDVLE